MVANCAVHHMAASGGRAKVGWCLTVEDEGEHEEQEHDHTYIRVQGTASSDRVLLQALRS